MSTMTLAYEPVIIDRVLTEAECDRLIDNATPVLNQSLVELNKVSNDRTSKQTWFGTDSEQVGDIVLKLRRRCAQLTGVFRNELFEKLQVARYESGQEYRRHYDSVLKDNVRIHRRATLLVYLTSDYVGGGTHFPTIDMMCRPTVRGDGILFYNVDADTGSVLPDSLHAGDVVCSGTKWIATCWVKFDASAPRV